MNIMLIDDDRLMIEYLQKMLNNNSLGYKITAIYYDGQSALNAFVDSNIDLVIADISMPKMDGLEFSKKALEINKNVKIILLTSYAKFEYAKAAIDIGVYKFILKHELNKEQLINDLRTVKELIDTDNQKKISVLNSQIYNFLINNSTDSNIDVLNTRLVMVYNLNPLVSIGHVNSKINLSIYNDQDYLGMYDNISLFLDRSKSETYVSKNKENTKMFIVEGYKNLSKLKFLFYDIIRYNRDFIYFNNGNFNESLIINDVNLKTFIESMYASHYKNAKQWLLDNKEIILNCNNVSVFKIVENVINLSYKGEGMISYDSYSSFSIIIEALNLLYDEDLCKYSIKVRKTIEYIKENYSKNISLDIIANEIGVSSDYLGKLFKKETKNNFSNYLTNYKMDIAKKMIETGNYKMYEVSDFLGYQNSQYFSNVFKKVKGYSPSFLVGDKYDE